jgi:hypothetical protein
VIVNLKGTFSKDQRPNNGLDAIAEALNRNRLRRIAVVGIIAYHAHHEAVGRPESITVEFEAIEATDGDADEQVRQILDQQRKARGLGQVELTLFDESPAGGSTSAGDAGRDPTAGPWPGDAEFVAPPSVVAAGDAVAGADGPEDDGPTSERTPDVWLDEDGTSGSPTRKPRRRKPATPDGQ